MKVYSPADLADKLQLDEERIYQMLRSEEIFSEDYYHVTESDLKQYFINQNRKLN